MIREYVVKVTDTFLPGAFQRFESEWSPEQELVRCTDCKYFDNYNVECMKNHDPKPPYEDWFCADGERKESR